MGSPRKGRSKFQTYDIYVDKYNCTISIPIYYEKKGNELGMFVSETISTLVSATKTIQISGFRSQDLADFQTYFQRCVEQQTQEELKFKLYELVTTGDIIPELNIVDVFMRTLPNELMALYRMLGLDKLRYLAVNSEGVVYSSGDRVHSSYVQQVQVNMSDYRLLTDTEIERKTTELLSLIERHKMNLEKVHAKFKEDASAVLSTCSNAPVEAERSALSDLLKEYY